MRRFRHHDGSVCRLSNNSVWEIEKLPRGMDLSDPEKVGEPCPHCNRYLTEDPIDRFDRVWTSRVRTRTFGWFLIGWSILLLSWNGVILAQGIDPVTVTVAIVLTVFDLVLLAIGVRGLRWLQRRSGREVKEQSTPPK